MKSKPNQQNTFLRLITSPYRAFCRARDFYVNSMMQCAAGFRGAGTALHSADLPRSFSVNSVRSDQSDDLRELIRAASVRNGKIGGVPHSEMRKTSAAAPRSVSVGMGRIDEERPCCNFGEEMDADVKKESMRYNRSKSHAVARTSF